jgi:hypothetical protein
MTSGENAQPIDTSPLTVARWSFPTYGGQLSAERAADSDPHPSPGL